ncbi:MAG: ABC transporter permease [Actinomycetota bacterium]|nr:ABC transporter permease [Actinomycetota bacterium]
MPSSSIPGWLRAFVDYQPITQIVDAVRGFLLDQSGGTAGWQAFAWCAGILVVFVQLSVSLYRRTTAC